MIIDGRTKTKWIDKKPVRLGISIIMIAGLIVISYDLFLSPDAPEEVDTTFESGKELAKAIIPSVVEETAKDDPDIEYVEVPDFKLEPKHDADNHTHDKITMIPMTILDMVYFLNDHPEISDQDSGILMSYAVAKETGMNADEEVDHFAYHIMEKIQ